MINSQASTIRKNLQAVVDAVNNVIGGGLEGDEAGLVLLDDVLLGAGKSGDVVNIGDGLVGAVGDDLAGGAGVHAGHLEVDADVGVVDVDGGGSAEVGEVLVVDDGVGGSGGGEGSSGGTGGLTEELTAAGLGVEGGGLGTSLLGHEGGSGAVVYQMNKMPAHASKNHFEHITCCKSPISPDTNKEPEMEWKEEMYVRIKQVGINENLPSRLLCSNPHHRVPAIFVTSIPGSEWDRIAEKLFICPHPTNR